MAHTFRAGFWAGLTILIRWEGLFATQTLGRVILSAVISTGLCTLILQPVVVCPSLLGIDDRWAYGALCKQVTTRQAERIRLRVCQFGKWPL